MATATNFRDLGDAVLTRLGRGKVKSADSVPVPASLKAPLDAFAAEQAIYAALCDKADKGRLKHDAALKAIGNSDAMLDLDINLLANALVGAGLGTRKNPFEGLIPQTPYGLTKLAYADTPPAVRKLVAAVLARTPAADIVKLAGQLLNGADDLDAKLKALDLPQTEFAAAMAKRDGELPQWHKVMNALKAYGKVAWLEEPGTWKAVFAVPAAGKK